MQRHLDAAPGIDALAHLEAEPPRHEGDLLAVAQVVEIGAVAARDLEDVAKALGGDQRGPGAGPLRNRVDHGGSAVHEVVHGVGVESGLVDGIEHAPREIVRRAERLGDAERAGLLVEVDEVREGPADIGRQSAHRALLPLGSAPIIHRRGRGSNGSIRALGHRLSCNCNTDVTIVSRRFGKNRRIDLADDREPACACLDALRCQTGDARDWVRSVVSQFLHFAFPSRSDRQTSCLTRIAHAVPRSMVRSPNLPGRGRNTPSRP